MARPTTTPAAEALQPYTVTRAMCMAGERVEVGATVHLTRTQGTELFAAGKVTPGAAEPAEAQAKPKKTKIKIENAMAERLLDEAEALLANAAPDATADATPTQEAAP